LITKEQTAEIVERFYTLKESMIRLAMTTHPTERGYGLAEDHIGKVVRDWAIVGMALLDASPDHVLLMKHIITEFEPQSDAVPDLFEALDSTPETNQDKGDCIDVVISVAVASDGVWNACGWNDEHMRYLDSAAEEGIYDPSSEHVAHIVHVKASVPLPTPKDIPVVDGQVVTPDALKSLDVLDVSHTDSGVDLGGFEVDYIPSSEVSENE
jgi:hypothetical protein